MPGRIQVILLAVLVEVAYSYPIYCVMALGLKTPLSSITTFWVFITVSLVTVLFHCLLLTRKWSLLTVWSWYLFWYMLVAVLLVKGVFHQPFWGADVLSKIQIANIFIFYLWIWIRTGLLASKKITFQQVISRFELSMVVMFGGLLIAETTGLAVPDITACMLLGFTGNLLMLAITKPGHEKTKAWVVMVFFTLVLLPAMTIAGLFKAYLYGFSNNIFGIAQPAANILINIFVVILGFLLGKGIKMPERATVVSTSNNQLVPAISIENGPSENLFFIKLLLYLFVTVIIIMIILGMIYLFRRIWLRLKTPTPRNDIFQKLHFNFSFKNIFKNIALLISLIFPVKYGVLDAYSQFLKWAAWKRCPKEAWETPYEFCNRISKQIPNYKTYYKNITDSYVIHSYGNVQISSRDIVDLKRMIKKLYFQVKI